MKLLEISVETDGEAAEAIHALFNRYNRYGAVIEEEWPERPAVPVVRVKTFLPAEQSCALSQIEEALWHLGRLYPIPAPAVRWLEEADWAEVWKSSYKPLRIGQRIVIKPSWQSLAATPEQIVIELDPGMAFGTGLHPSTRLILEALEHHIKPGDRVLDVGTGSGILAIAAARMGAGNVLALDVDGVALEVAHKNFTRNGVQERISLQRASLTPGAMTEDSQQPVPALDARGVWSGSFDLLLMNILADVIAHSAEAIAACLADGGLAIVAGILQAQEEHVRQALETAGLRIVKRHGKKDWVALVARKETESREGA